MTSRAYQLTAMVALAAVLWIVPSNGTRGQGTLGDRFTHADQRLLGDNAADRAALRRADTAVNKAISGL